MGWWQEGGEEGRRESEGGRKEWKGGEEGENPG